MAEKDYEGQESSGGSGLLFDLSDEEEDLATGSPDALVSPPAADANWEPPAFLSDIL